MKAPRVVLIDNYDSFTWNVVHEFGALGADVEVVRNDAASVADILRMGPDAIVVSPGPCTPRDAGICLPLIKKAGPTIPIFGVCLGHQAIGEAFGGEIIRAPIPIHGKVATITHRSEALFRGLNGAFRATRYHSLIIERSSLPTDLYVTAETDGLIMGVSHRKLPIHGVQFHPESIASESGRLIMKNFLDLAQDWNQSASAARVAVGAV